MLRSGGGKGTGLSGASASRRRWQRVVAALLIISSTQVAGQRVAARKAVGLKHAVVNFADLARQQAAAPLREPVPRVVEEGELPGPRPVPAAVAAKLAAKARSAPRLKVQAPAAAPVPAATPAPKANFAGLSDVSLDGFSHIPPDTEGAVGPNHLMIALNNGVLVQTRTGGTAKAAVGLSAFWGISTNNNCNLCALDPHVLYDPFIDRWIFVAVAAPHITNSVVLVGMSKTNDPTGNWSTYSLPADQTAAAAKTTPTLWGDYPLVGFNKTWVVVTVNMYTISASGNTPANTFTKGTIFAFDINSLINGVTSPSAAVFDDPNASALCPAATLDPNLATLYMVESFNGNSNNMGILRISTMTGAVGSEVYTAASSFPSTLNPWAQTGPGDNFAPQLNGDANHLIDTGDDRILNVVYRNGSLWTTQNVFLPASSPTRSAVQWWQLSTTGSVQQVGRIDDSTAVNFYAYPSIAVNKNNDILLGFSHFSASIFAEAVYAFGPYAGGANTLQAPLTYKTGEVFYFVTFTGTRNRWGDYSATVVDPVNDLDFWTLQEYASSQNLCSVPNSTCTGGWGTWWAQVAVPARKRLVQVTAE